MVEIIFLLILAGFFAWGTALENQQQRISNEMVRLHVVANSDSEEDQALKLEVRDAVLAAAIPLVEQAKDVTEAKRRIEENLTVLEAAAEETLHGLGQKQNVTVCLNRELFGTRHYAGFSLPGGYYDALRVTIGEGGGKNWWCVVYPQICMASTTEQQEAVAVMAGMTEEDVAIIQAESEEYELKFKTLEIFENILTWFRSRGKGIPTSR